MNYFCCVLDLSVDAMDVSGDHQLDVDHNIFKKRLGLDGKALPMGPERQNGMHTYHFFSIFWNWELLSMNILILSTIRTRRRIKRQG